MNLRPFSGHKRYILLLFMAATGTLLTGQLSAADTYREAYDSGYSDGLKAGRKDRDQQGAFDFANKKAYQSAETGYDEARHDRGVYVVAYRRGFQDGYEEGYGLRSGGSTQALPLPPAPDNPAASPGQVSPLRSSTSTGTLTLPVGTHIDIKLLDTLSTQRNARGDPFRAEVIRAVHAPGGALVIAPGMRVEGTIVYVKRAGRIKGRSEMSLRFDEMILPDGTRLPILATLVSIEDRADEEVEEEGTLKGAGSKTDDAKKIGVATGIGALIGVLTGGGKGGKIGAAGGAIGALAGVLATRGRDIDLYSETEMTIKLDRPLEISAHSLRNP